MKQVLPNSTIGVFGSGQLGRMFAIEARKMGYRVHTFSPESDTPTGQVADVETSASYEDLDAVREFARSVDVVTFEFENVPSATVLFRPIWKGVLIAAGGFTGEAADAAIRDGHADAVAFGRIFISNPDLPRRLQHGFPLTPYNRATFYGGDVAGYTDYPEHDELEQA